MNLKIKVSKKPRTGGLVSYRYVGIREKVLRFLFGEKQKLTILVPGDNVDEIDICRNGKGGTENDSETED